MLIFPAIDIIGGQCVRLKQGDYGKLTRYRDNPLEVAQEFVSEGADWIHVVDLDGAEAKSPVNLGVLSDLVNRAGARIQFGGGLRSAESVAAVLDLGVDRVVLGSMLVKQPDLAQQIFAKFGEKIVAGVDVRRSQVAVDGWTETTGYSGIELAKNLEKSGASRLILTDIATDGMLSGPNTSLLKELGETLSIPIIASGGVGTIDHLVQLAQMKDVEGAIVGTALYEGRFTLRDAIRAVS